MSTSVHTASVSASGHPTEADDKGTGASMVKSAGASFVIPPFSTDPVIETENYRLHAIHDEGYEANCDGDLLAHNPYPSLSIEFSAWHAGHIAAQEHRDEWEEANHERARRFA